MRIESYSFGNITVDGRQYKSDIIILPDRIIDNWWRDEGHRLQPQDLKDIIAAKPDILIIGTGMMGVMRVPKETIDFIEKHGIEIRIARTGSAVELFNASPQNKKTAAALHLTC